MTFRDWRWWTLGLLAMAMAGFVPQSPIGLALGFVAGFTSTIIGVLLNRFLVGITDTADQEVQHDI